MALIEILMNMVSVPEGMMEMVNPPNNWLSELSRFERTPKAVISNKRFIYYALFFLFWNRIDRFSLLL